MIRFVLALLVLSLPLSAEELLFDVDSHFYAFIATESTIFVTTLSVQDQALWAIDRATGHATRIAESVYCVAPVSADTVVFGSRNQLWYGGAGVPLRFLYESPVVAQATCAFPGLAVYDGAAYWLEELAGEPAPAYALRRLHLDSGLVQLFPQRVEGRLRGFDVDATGMWVMTESNVRRVALDGSNVETLLEETDLNALHVGEQAAYAVSGAGLWRISRGEGNPELLLGRPHLQIIATSGGEVWVAAVSADDREQMTLLRLGANGGETTVVAEWRTRAHVTSVSGIRVPETGRIWVATSESVPRSLYPFGAVYDVSPGRARMVIDEPWVRLIAADEDEIIAAVSDPPVTGASRIIRVPVRARGRLVTR